MPMGAGSASGRSIDSPGASAIGVSPTSSAGDPGTVASRSRSGSSTPNTVLADGGRVSAAQPRGSSPSTKCSREAVARTARGTVTDVHSAPSISTRAMYGAPGFSASPDAGTSG